MHVLTATMDLAGPRPTLRQHFYQVDDFIWALGITAMVFLPEVVLVVVQKVMTRVGPGRSLHSLRSTSLQDFRAALPPLAVVLSSVVVLLDAVSDFLVAGLWILEGQLQGCSKAAADTFTLAGHLAIFFIVIHFTLAFSLALPALISGSYSPNKASTWLGRVFGGTTLCALVATFIVGKIKSTQAGALQLWDCDGSIWPAEWVAAAIFLAAIVMVALMDGLARQILEQMVTPAVWLLEAPGRVDRGYFEHAGMRLFACGGCEMVGRLLCGAAYTVACFCAWVLYATSLALGLGSGANAFEILQRRGGIHEWPLGGVLTNKEKQFNRRTGAFYALESIPMVGLQIWAAIVYRQHGLPVPMFQWLSLAISAFTSSGLVLGVIASGKSPAMLWGEIFGGLRNMCCCGRARTSTSINFSYFPELPSAPQNP